MARFSQVALATVMMAVVLAGAYAAGDTTSTSPYSPTTAKAPVGYCAYPTFCERWMCEQNFNRRCRIAEALNVDCQEAPNDPEFVEQWKACNETQSGANLLDDACDVRGGSDVVGMNLDVSTCSMDKPPQLVAMKELHIQAESRALEEVKQAKRQESARIYNEEKAQCGTPGFTPTRVCICNPAVTMSACEGKIRRNYLSVQPQLNTWLELYVKLLAEQFVLLDLVPAGADANATAALFCLQRFPGTNYCSEEVATFTSPPIQPNRR